MTSSDDGQHGVGGPPPADGSTPREPSPPGQQSPPPPPAPPQEQQGYGAPGQQQGYGAPGQQQGYGAPGQQQGYGAPGQQQGYGAPGQQQGYGAPGQQQGYGAPGQQQGYGAPGQQQGYGAPGQQQGYGAPGQQQGYGAPGQQQGYGAPGQQQGYGAPGQQQGYGAPGQQQGYGAPGQQQGYGAPGQQQGYGAPGQQQGYGAPGQYPYSTPTQPQGWAQNGGGSQRRPRWLLPGGIGAGALVVVVLLFFVVRIALGAIGVTGGAGGNTSQSGAGGPLSGKVQWSGYLPPPQAPSVAGEFAQEYKSAAIGSWLGGGVLAIETYGSIVGVDQHTGKERWSLPAPSVQGAPGAFCGRSVTSANGLAAVGVAGYASLYGTVSPICNSVMLLDLSTGKARWMWTDSQVSGLTMHPEIVGDTVVADPDGQIVGLSLSTGHVAWQFQDSEVNTVPYDSCLDQFMNAGSTLDVFSVCEQAPSVLAQLDPSTGKVVSKTSFPSSLVNSETQGELISASPAVIAVSGAHRTDGSYLVVEGGKVVTIPQTGSYGTLDMEQIGPGDGHALLPVVVSGSYLVTRNLPKNPDASRTPDDLVAFDLGTGRELWKKNLVNVSKSMPIAIEGGNLIAIITGVYEDPPQIFQVSLKSGAARAMGPPYSRSLIETPDYSQMFWRDSHLYGASLSNIGKGFLLYSLG